MTWQMNRVLKLEVQIDQLGLETAALRGMIDGLLNRVETLEGRSCPLHQDIDDPCWCSSKPCPERCPNPECSCLCRWEHSPGKPIQTHRCPNGHYWGGLLAEKTRCRHIGEPGCRQNPGRDDTHICPYIDCVHPNDPAATGKAAISADRMFTLADHNALLLQAVRKIITSDEAVEAFGKAWKREELSGLGRPRTPGAKRRAGLQAVANMILNAEVDDE